MTCEQVRELRLTKARLEGRRCKININYAGTLKNGCLGVIEMVYRSLLYDTLRCRVKLDDGLVRNCSIDEPVIF